MSLILSKLIVAVIWGIAGTIVGILCGSIFGVINVPLDAIGSLFQELPALFAHISGTEVYYIIAVILGSIISYSVFVLVMYLSLSFGQLPIAGKHRTATSLLAFFGIYVVYSIIAGFFGFSLDSVNIGSIAMLNISIGIEVLMAILLFFATNFILKKHLNLE